jgi:uncharacterized membrane protein
VPAAPGLAEALLVILRWLHALAAIGFLGWSAVLWLDGPGQDPPVASQRFKEVTELSLVVFLATGAILSFDRLSHGAGGGYATVLAVKVLSAVLAYQYAFVWRRRSLSAGLPEGRAVLLFGAAAVLLAAILKEIFERALVRGDL